MQITIENISEFLYTANNGDAHYKSCLTGEPYNFFLTSKRKKLFDNIGFSEFLTQLNVGIHSLGELGISDAESERYIWQYLIVPYIFIFPDNIIKQSFIHAFDKYTSPKQTKKLIYLILKSPFFHKIASKTVNYVMNAISEKRQEIFRDFFINIILKNINKCKYEYSRIIYNLHIINEDLIPKKYYPSLISLTRHKNVDIRLAISFISKLINNTDSIINEIKEYLTFLINKRKYIKQQLSFYDQVKKYLTIKEQQYYDKKLSKKSLYLFA